MMAWAWARFKRHCSFRHSSGRLLTIRRNHSHDLATTEQEEKLRAAPEHKHKEQRGGTSHAGATASVNNGREHVSMFRIC